MRTKPTAVSGRPTTKIDRRQTGLLFVDPNFLAAFPFLRFFGSHLRRRHALTCCSRKRRSEFWEPSVLVVGSSQPPQPSSVTRGEKYAAICQSQQICFVRKILRAQEMRISVLPASSRLKETGVLRSVLLCYGWPTSD